MFFVVVGDIDGDKVEAQIRAAFANSKLKPLPPVVLPVEPAQAGQREIVEEAPIELGHFHMAWHIPDVRHPDIPALDVLATLLGAGHSSRLYQEVREKQGIVHSVDAWTYNPGNPGLLGMSAVVDANQFEPAHQALLAQVERMKTELVPPAELAKAVKQFTAGTLATRKTMQGQAQDLGGNWIAAADLNFSERYLAAVKRLTPQDLQRVARHYLTIENRTVYALLPKGAKNLQRETKVRVAENPVQTFTLPNGLRLLVKEDHRLPFVEFRGVFKGGVLAETPRNNGATLLLAKMLLKGTPTRTAEQLVTEIESLGGSIETYGGNNSLGVSGEVLSSDFDKGVELLSDVILNPVFPSGSLERERQVQLAGIRAQKDQLLQSASRAMRRTLFGESAYGLDVHGNEESISHITTADLRGLYTRLVVPNNCVLAVYGDIKADQVKAAIEKSLGGWKAGSSFPQEDRTRPILKERKHVQETRDKRQAVLVIGFPGVSVHDPERYALELIQEALSDLGSRLFVRIRENLGLAYYVGAQNFLGLQPGYFALYAGTSPEKASLVELELLKEVEELRRDGLTEAELKRAKAKVIGQKKIARQDLGAYAITTALDELYGLGYGNIDTEDAHFEAVTLDQIKAATQWFLDPNACVVSVIIPENASEAEPKEMSMAEQ